MLTKSRTQKWIAPQFLVEKHTHKKNKKAESDSEPHNKLNMAYVHYSLLAFEVKKQHTSLHYDYDFLCCRKFEKDKIFVKILLFSFENCAKNCWTPVLPYVMNVSIHLFWNSFLYSRYWEKWKIFLRDCYAFANIAISVNCVLF